MTAATQASRRPVKPGRSRAIYAGIAAFLAITILSVSERWGIGLDIGGLVEDIGNGEVILRQLLNPNWAFLPRVVDPLIETLQIAIIAAFIGCAIALPITFLASRTTVPNRPTLTISRGILSVVRAIPDFLYALIFVAAVGIGPLGGILAL
ncbi:MAG: phosphonate ABC transporter, permease protein PhnE, partial [Chloroflexota bacterium]|nr:phosphonate ABC transporter, permease protein PhnE [Chloroflexota bacterium]